MKVIAAGMLLACVLTGAASGQTALTYQKPPADIEALLDAPPTPLVRVSPDHRVLLVQQPQTFPTIAEVAQPRYRLAGIRFNPATNGPSREVSTIKMWLQPIGGTEKPIAGLPACRVTLPDCPFSVILAVGAGADPAAAVIETDEVAD